MNKYKKHFDLFVQKKSPVKKKEVQTKNEVLSFNINFPKIPKLLEVMAFFKVLKMGFSFYSKFSTKKQTFFAKRLSFLIKAGVPMLESMHVIKKQTKSKSEIRVFEKIIADVSNGQTLASALSRFKGVFGNFTINLIKAGESSGTLTENLNYLADELKKKEVLRRKIMSSLLYPLIVTIATFGITGFLIVYIFPKITPIFNSLNAQLPLSTRVLMYITNVLKNDGIAILSGLFVLVVGIILAIKYLPRVRFFFDGFILRIPLLGVIVKNYNITNITRTMGLLLKSGVTLSESLIITAETTNNTQYKKSLVDASNIVIKGKGMSELFNKSEALFPVMLGHMISIGERSGNLSNTLIYLSEYYEHEFDEITKNLSSTIEPVLMIIMGAMVGFVAISVITPIYEITTSIRK